MSSKTLENGTSGSAAHKDDYPLAEMDDITQSQLWKQVEEFFTNVHAPSFGRLSNAEDLAVSPDGTRLAFTGYVRSSLQGGAQAQVYLIDMPGEADSSANPVPVIVSHGPYNSKKPKWSPDGKTLVFLSDRARE